MAKTLEHYMIKGCPNDNRYCGCDLLDLACNHDYNIVFPIPEGKALSQHILW